MVTSGQFIGSKRLLSAKTRTPRFRDASHRNLVALSVKCVIAFSLFARNLSMSRRAVSFRPGKPLLHNDRARGEPLQVPSLASCRQSPSSGQQQRTRAPKGGSTSHPSSPTMRIVLSSDHSAPAFSIRSFRALMVKNDHSLSDFFSPDKSEYL